MKLDVAHIRGCGFKRDANHISTDVSPSRCFSGKEGTQTDCVIIPTAAYSNNKGNAMSQHD